MSATPCPSFDGMQTLTLQDAPEVPMTQPRPPTILLVDDEREICEALGAGLRRGLGQARVITASDGVEALEMLSREPVDVIISDNKMPRLAGIDFLVQARQLAPEATRMMLTAHPEEKLLERNVNEARVRYFFTKPYSLNDVIANVKSALEHQRERRERASALAQAIARMQVPG